MEKDAKAGLFGRAARFMSHGLWRVRAESLAWPLRAGLQALRFVCLVAGGFRRDQCALHAASLTFFSLMALVPVLVLALALARAFGGAELAKDRIDAHLNRWMVQMEQSVEAQTAAKGTADVQVHAEVTRAFSGQVRDISDKLFAQVKTISFGTLGGIGLLMLLWTVIGVLGKVETSFNQVWGIERTRPFVRKFSDYLSVILLLPFLITAVSTVPVVGMLTRVMDQAVGGPAAAFFKAVLNSGLLRTGLLLTLGTLTFGFLLGFMPNIRVRPLPALAGGFVTILLFAAWLKLCAMLQVGIAKYSALYGGFAVLPILLMWVYMSWQIVLLGAEISFAVQNRDLLDLGRHADSASLRARLLLALTLCAEAARLAREPEGGPFAAEAYAKRRGIPYRFAKETLDSLARHQVLAEVAGRPGEYLLCRCGESLCAADVARALLTEGEPPEALGLGEPQEALAALDAALVKSVDAALGVPLAKL